MSIIMVSIHHLSQVLESWSLIFHLTVIIHTTLWLGFLTIHHKTMEEIKELLPMFAKTQGQFLEVQT